MERGHESPVACPSLRPWNPLGDSGCLLEQAPVAEQGPVELLVDAPQQIGIGVRGTQQGPEFRGGAALRARHPAQDGVQFLRLEVTEGAALEAAPEVREFVVVRCHLSTRSRRHGMPTYARSRHPGRSAAETRDPSGLTSVRVHVRATGQRLDPG
jgi:hypothetical protein